jgi:hypothetical protein
MRYVFYLIFEMIDNEGKKVVDHHRNDAIKRVLLDVSNIVSLEIREQSIGFRLLLAWRNIGRGLRISGRLQNVLELCAQSLQSLSLPDKPKASLLGKKNDRDYELKLQLWAAVLSTLRRTRLPPPSPCHQNLVTATAATSSNVSASSTAALEMIRTHAIEIIKSSLECRIKHREDLTADINLLQSYFKRAKAQRSAISSDATTSNTVMKEDVNFYRCLLACLRLIGDASENLAHDPLVADLYLSAWHLLGGPVQATVVKEVKKEAISIDANKLFVSMIESFLQHRRYALIAREISKSNATTNGPNTGLISVFVRSLSNRLSPALDSAKVSALGMLNLSILMRSACRLGRWMRREQIADINLEDLYALRSALVDILNEANNFSFYYSMQDKQNQARGMHLQVQVIEALTWLLPTFSKPCLRPAISLQAIYEKLLEDDQLDASLRILLLSQLLSRSFAVSSSAAVTTPNRDRIVNPSAAIATIDLLIKAMKKYPCPQTRQLIQQAWSQYAAILNSSSNYASFTSSNSLGNKSRGHLFDSLMGCLNLDLSQCDLKKSASASTSQAKMQAIAQLRETAVHFLSDEVSAFLFL